LTSFYTAELTAFLTLVDSSLPVQNLQDLKNDPSAKWIAIAGATFQNMVEVKTKLQVIVYISIIRNQIKAKKF
jgi:hypothetical protein